MEILTSTVTVIIIASFIIYLLNAIIPNGAFRKTVNFIFGIVIVILIIQPIIKLKNDYYPQEIITTQNFNFEYYSVGIKMQIRQYDGFENAQVSVYGNNKSIESIFISVDASQSSTVVNFEKNKIIITNLLEYLYKVDKNNIKIEVK